MALGTLIGAGLNIASTIIKNGQEKRQFEKSYQDLVDNEKELDEWYQKKSNSDYIDSTTVKDGVIALSEDKQNKDEELANNSIRSGTTTEAAVAKAASNNKSYSDSVYQIAKLGDNFRNDIENRYMKNKAVLDSNRRELEKSYPTGRKSYIEIMKNNK